LPPGNTDASSRDRAPLDKPQPRWPTGSLCTSRVSRARWLHPISGFRIEPLPGSKQPCRLHVPAPHMINRQHSGGRLGQRWTGSAAAVP
jgi:hypothetical protein